MQKLLTIFLVALAFCGCAGRSAKTGVSSAPGADSASSEPQAATAFNADSAYAYVARQVEFGPRVPNTESHRQCGAWLAEELQRHGAKVTEQNVVLRAFDGTQLKAKNIFGQYNPEAKDRTLLLAHWDCRPWADEDPDAANHGKPVDGANDGASGTGVLLEIARQLGAGITDRGIDILFVDAEDWGSDGDEDSWALGTKYFVSNPPVESYMPSKAILLDMVGGRDALFCREYFSEQSAPNVSAQVWATAESLGYGNLFVNRMGGAITDDHVQLIEHGIPAIDIIEYHPGSAKGFSAVWHTAADNMDAIDPATLGAVGNTVLTYITK